MIGWILSWLVGPDTCDHEWVSIPGERTREGVTIGWDGRPTVSWSLPCRCEYCGETGVQTGMLLPRMKYEKDETGWPVDEDGARLPRTH